MDRRGECCIARYINGGVYDMSKVDRIMLRFRPIAPKPATGAAVSGGSPAESTERASSKTGRGKRRYNKENNKNSNKKIKSNNKTELTRKTSIDSVVTLSLLPESPERKESQGGEKSESWLSFGNEISFWPLDGGHVANQTQQTAVMSPQLVTAVTAAVTSVVTVECVTDTWLDINTLGRNDEEKMVSLMNDTCPAFVSDGGDRVKWSNRAYREMVGNGSEEVVVGLVMRERVAVACDAFSCNVKVRWTSATCRKGGAMTLPCDVWRMDGGGFVWRLDVEAALSLGRLGS